MKIKGLFYLCVFSMVILLTMVNNGFADTNVSGLVSTDTTWTLAKSPYIVTGNVLVKEGVTLTIEPGVTVKFNSGKSLHVNGTLIAKGGTLRWKSGIKGGAITFTKNSDDNWEYILFSDSSKDAVYEYHEDGREWDYTEGSIMENCIVEYAGNPSSYSISGAIKIDKAYPFINRCLIQYNTATGIYAYNTTYNVSETLTSEILENLPDEVVFPEDLKDKIYYVTANQRLIFIGIMSKEEEDKLLKLSTDIPYKKAIEALRQRSFNKYPTLKIYNCAVYKNCSGIYCAEDSLMCAKIEIKLNLICSNIHTGQSPYVNGVGIHCDTGGAKLIHHNIIYNNTIGGTYLALNGGGIYCGKGSTSIKNNIICNNATAYGGGIYCEGGLFFIYKNYIAGNSARTRAGIDYCNSEEISDFKYNTITGNKSTPTNGETCTVRAGWSPLLFNHNNIFANSAAYELWNDNAKVSGDLNAKNNWWGTAIDADIQSKIYDFIDDDTKGIVDYSPFETVMCTDAPIFPPISLTAITDAGQIILKWSANKESDVAGYRVYWGTGSGRLWPVYENFADVGKQTSYTIKDVADGKYYVTVTAYDNDYKPDIGSDHIYPNIINENQTNGNESWYAQEEIVVINTALTTKLNSNLPGEWSGKWGNKAIKLFITKEGNQLLGKIISDEVEEKLKLRVEFFDNREYCVILEGTDYKPLKGIKGYSLDTLYVEKMDLPNNLLEGNYKDTSGNTGKWSVTKMTVPNNLTSTPPEVPEIAEGATKKQQPIKEVRLSEALQKKSYVCLMIKDKPVVFYSMIETFESNVLLLHYGKSYKSLTGIINCKWSPSKSTYIGVWSHGDYNGKIQLQPENDSSGAIKSFSGYIEGNVTPRTVIKIKSTSLPF